MKNSTTSKKNIDDYWCNDYANDHGCLFAGTN